MNNPLSQLNSVIFPLDDSFQFPEQNFTSGLQSIPEKQDLLLPKTSILEPEEDPTLLLTSKSQQFVEPTEIESQSIPKINKNSNIADKSSEKEIKDVLTGNVQNSSQRLARSGEVDNAGNEFVTARDLGTLGKKQIFRDFVGDSDAIDYYRFEVTEKGSVVNLQLKGLSSNASLTLYNSNGEYIDYSDNDGTTPEVINTPLGVGTYYIKVSPDYWSSSNTQYNLTVSSKPDVGNTIKDAQNLGVLKGKKNLTDFVVGEWYDKSDPADYYRFQIKKWSNVKLAVTGLENEANVELLSGSGAVIKSLDSVGDSAQTITETLKPGSYYIKADTNWTQAKYNIELSSSAASENPASISNLSFSGKEGDKGTFEIQLKQKPKSNVTLKFINGKYLTVDADNDVFTGTQDTITFTPANWNKPRKASFIAEVDGVKSNRKSGNTIDYSVSGSMKGGGTYNLGTIVNTYNLNIDLDFRIITDVVKYTNTERAKAGLPALTTNNLLNQAAQTHSQNMATQDFFSHQGKDGKWHGDRITATGYDADYSSENIAVGYSTPKQVVTGWMNSSGHRQSILSPELTQIGVGYYFLQNDPGSVQYQHYWTQNFAHPDDGQDWGSIFDDLLYGDNGNNTLTGGSGNDQVSGGDGKDTLFGNQGNDVVDGGYGQDILYGGSGTDIMWGGDYDGSSTDDDKLYGEDGNDFLSGQAGNDLLSGSLGNDYCWGDSGNDSLTGGAGNDTLTGGEGADKFIYNTNAAFTKLAVGVDTITDFDISQTDQIVLDKTTFTSISSAAGTGFSVASEFAKVTSDALAATSAADIVYNTTTGGLFYNQNGTAAGLGTGAQFLTLTNKPVLTATQFLIQA